MMFEEALAAVVRDAVRPLQEEVARLREELKTAKRVDGPKYLSPEHAAEIADVEPDTIRDWVKAGRLPRYGAGRGVRVKLDDLEELMRRDGGSDAPTVDLDAMAAKIVRGRRK